MHTHMHTCMHAYVHAYIHPLRRCDPFVQDWRGGTALHVAAAEGGAGVPALLSALSWGGACEARGGEGRPGGGRKRLARVVDGLGRSALHVWGYKRERGGLGVVTSGYQALVASSECVQSHPADGGWKLTLACMYVCMCVCMYVCMHVLYVCTYLSVYVCMYVFV